MATTVQAGPTKRFFVQMLTRDIDLKDAILDLLDNCLDGVLRQQKAKLKKGEFQNGRPYDGFWAKIKASPEGFEILDNCGGIPQKIAEESAFMLGRPDLKRDAEIETVGMYGIGMKRAIFKLGRKCSVVSHPKTGAYRVEISPSWLDKEGDWELPLNDDVDGLEHPGTWIKITKLLEPIKLQFNKSRSPFLKELRQEISQLYALIIDKGFTVYVNDDPVDAADLTLLLPRKESVNGAPSIKPYVFKGTIDGVEVDLAVGFYRPLATIAELEDEQQAPRSRGHAGWTVICNDRVVLHADTSPITGWGTATVPRYHNQFISIAGVVSFRSTNSLALPLNTTKRGLDTTSSVYLFVLDMMREGLKKFIDFTNKWKAREKETSPQFKQLESRKFSEASDALSAEKWSDVRKAKGRGVAQKFNPTLPLPENKNANRRISFSRPKQDIEIVSQYIFDDPNVKPSEVGARCFDDYLEEANQ